VTGYGAFQEVSATPMVRRELPAPGLVLLLSLGPLSVFRGVGGLSRVEPSATLVGVGRGAVTAAHPGAQTVLEVRLSPVAAVHLFGVPAADLIDRVVDLAELWGEGAAELIERVAAAATWPQRFDLLDATLAAREDRRRPVDPVLAGAWQEILHRRGDLSMSVLHDQTGWSRRRLASAFREQVGLTPKTMARLVRFQHAAGLLQRSGHRSLASVALTCGYYDQAHFTNEFREWAGCTPSSYVAGLTTDPAGTGMGAP
jgi:AraC-like DNA-binding protein